MKATHCKRRNLAGVAARLWFYVAGLSVFAAFAGIALAESGTEPLVTLKTGAAVFAIDKSGSLCAISDLATGRNHLAKGQPAPLLSVRVDGKFYAPNAATWNAESKLLTLQFTTIGMRVVLSAEAKPTHAVFETRQVLSTNRTELALWGPYPTTIGDIIGEVVGVARNSEFAIGIQALNAKTLGGYPTKEDDIEVDYSADDPGHYPNLPSELNKDQLFRGDTARRTDFGSVLQAFCRNRNSERVIANWGHDKFVAPTYSDGGVVGSKIALFACRASQALETIGAIEVAEGLPHPMLDGAWAKVASTANCSYLIVDFSEETVARAIEMTRRAGLRYLYHSSPFETWGHFKLKPSLFPHGQDGLRTCVEKARQSGVRLGFHTLSNFITPNDSYVCPKPDSRLARIGASVLTSNIDSEQNEIGVALPDFFVKTTVMNTVMLGDELVRYGAVSTNSPWRLMDCQRGAWGTRAASHPAGSGVAKLMDHDYKVFLTDASLSQEVGRNIAELCNHAGTLQISLDGLEGNWSTGMGQYGRALFTKAWYDALSPELRGQINDASNPGHFNWHIYTRMNWGEPWYAGFRESQTIYRFKNQLHFERNLMPHMLGWFALRPDTSIEDAEWLLARAAGFDAGFALAASLASTAQLEADPNSTEAAKSFGATLAILDTVKQWETARQSRVFPPELKATLRDNKREFHLQREGENRWNLYAAQSEKFTHEATNEAPTQYTFLNANPAQKLQWTVVCAGKRPVTGLSLQINGKPVVALGTQSLQAGGSLKYSGGSEASEYDTTWKEVSRIAVDVNACQVGKEEQIVTIRCEPQAGASLKVELCTLGPAVLLGAHAGDQQNKAGQDM